MFNKINRNQSEEIIVPHLNTLIYKLNEIKYHIKDYNHCKVARDCCSWNTTQSKAISVNYVKYFLSFIRTFLNSKWYKLALIVELLTFCEGTKCSVQSMGIFNEYWMRRRVHTERAFPAESNFKMAHWLDFLAQKCRKKSQPVCCILDDFRNTPFFRSREFIDFNMKLARRRERGKML